MNIFKKLQLLFYKEIFLIQRKRKVFDEETVLHEYEEILEQNLESDSDYGLLDSDFEIDHDQ